MPEGDRACLPSELVLVAGKSRMAVSPGLSPEETEPALKV